jgi:hypothetical protein
MRRFAVLPAVALACLPSFSFGSELLKDTFDTDTSANWTKNQSPDNQVNFAFDYSAVGIPAAPGSGGITKGLRMTSNLVTGNGQQGVTLSPNGVNITNAAKGVLVTFDMWINANGPFPDGGTGSTQLFTAGVGYNGTAINRPSGLSGSGAWFGVTGEGGAARDFRAHIDNNEQLAYSGGNPVNLNVYAASSAPGNVAGLDQDNTSAYYAQFVGPTPPAAQTALFPNQTGNIENGSVGFAWRKVKIIGRGNTVRWYIDDLLIATLQDQPGGNSLVTGRVSLGYADPFASITDNADMSFGLADNYAVYALSSLGDVNDDGTTNNLDIAPFVAALVSGAALRPDIAFAADCNSDGVFNNLDIAPFVSLLTGSGAVSAGDPLLQSILALVPEPSTISLLGLAAAATLRRRRA